MLIRGQTRNTHKTDHVHSEIDDERKKTDDRAVRDGSRDAWRESGDGFLDGRGHIGAKIALQQRLNRGHAYLL